MYSIPIPDHGVSRRYLWLPVTRGAPLRRLRIFAPDGSLWQEAQIPAGEKPDWFVPLEVSRFAGQALSLELDAPAGWLSSVRVEPQPPAHGRKDRPVLHFTAGCGWLNDPNGLLFHDGCYHMFFQYNPYDIAWNNMQWGHAVSRDLLAWEQLDTALFPDETGTMYSGCAICDREGLLGYGRNTPAFYYTAAGGENDWSKGVPFTQKIAVMPADRESGAPLVKTGLTAVGALAPGNRDPKVFRHEESAAYIMVLYLEGNDFAIFRSADLRQWEMTQRLTLGRSWECPDLFRLPVEGTGQSRWVFWSADGFYYLGDFDGFRFTTDGVEHEAYAGQLLEGYSGARRLPYAAQTFSGTDGRVVQTAWMRFPNRGRPYTGMMSVPAELSLTETPGGLRLRMPYVRELEEARVLFTSRTGFAAGETSLSLPDTACWMMALHLPAGAELEVSFPFGALSVSGGNLSLLGEQFCDVPPGSLTILADHEALELHAANDTVCASWEIPPQSGGAAAVRSSRALPGARVELFHFPGKEAF